MRIPTLSAIVAVPLVVAAAVGDRHPHVGLVRRQRLIGSPIDIGISLPGLPVVTPSSAEPTTLKPSTPPVTTGPVRPSTPAPPTTQPSGTTEVNPPGGGNSTTSAVDPSSTNSSTAPSSDVSSTTALPSTSSTPTPSSTSEEPQSTAEPTSAPPETTSSDLSSSFTVKTVQGTAVTVFVTPTVTPTHAKSSEALSKGAIIGIAVGAAVGGLAVIAAIILCLLRKRQNDDEPMRWPELNHHGDTQTHHAVPVSRSTSDGDRRMSLGDELDGPPSYGNDVDPASNSVLNGSSFGAAAMLDYDEKSNAYPQQSMPQQAYGFDDNNDYTSYPPPVQPQPSPVHGAPYDWESDGTYSGENGYAGMTRQTSPTMAGVGAGAMSYPQPQAPHGHY